VALKAFIRSKEALLTNAAAMLMDAVCSLQLGQVQNATSVLNEMGPAPPIPPQLLFDFALEADKQRQYQLAFLAMKLVPETFPDPYTHGYDEALAAHASGNDAEAVSIIRDMLSRNLVSAELYDLLGNALEQQGIANHKPALVEEAYDAYRKGIYTDPHNLANFLDIGRLALKLGNYSLCEQLVSEGLKQNPSAYQLVLERGVAYSLASDAKNAATDFESARRRAPHNPLPYLAAGMLAIQDGRNGDAAKILQQGIDSSDSQNAWLYFLLARSLYKDGEDSPEAESRIQAALREAMRHNPNFAEAFGLAGHVWLKAGSVQEGIRFLETAHRLDPGNSHYVYALAVAKRMQGDSVKAAKDFQAFRQLEAANNPARTKEFFIRILANQPSGTGFREPGNAN
jgi:tetratricopeptide (TPR) repeat protein